MRDLIGNFLSEQGIELFSQIPLSSCKLSRPYLLGDIKDGTVFIFAVPYFTREAEQKRNISAYACAKDYHIFFKDLFDAVLPILKEKYPENKFLAFSDHSPIDERDAAVRAGLGAMGKNHMLITEKYSSYVFIGEIITDATVNCCAGEISECLSCGKCFELCPALSGNSECISSLTQKKGELDDAEILLIKSSPYIWGCDLCQEICPHTAQARSSGTIYTNIKFFNSDLTPYITSKSISEMPDGEFARRAYSWRKKETILRNLKIAEREDCEKNHLE